MDAKFADTDSEDDDNSDEKDDTNGDSDSNLKPNGRVFTGDLSTHTHLFATAVFSFVNHSQVEIDICSSFGFAVETRNNSQSEAVFTSHGMSTLPRANKLNEKLLSVRLIYFKLLA